MPVWKLTPTDLTDPAWVASTHHGGAVVRAASEGAARRVSAAALQASAGAPAGAPWTDPALVKVEEVQDPRYDPKGRSEILDLVA